MNDLLKDDRVPKTFENIQVEDFQFDGFETLFAILLAEFCSTCEIFE